MQTIFDNLLGKKIFSTLDFSRWVYQLPIRAADRYLTAFRASDGSLWAYNCAAFGLVNSPATVVYVNVLAATETLAEYKSVLPASAYLTLPRWQLSCSFQTQNQPLAYAPGWACAHISATTARGWSS